MTPEARKNLATRLHLPEKALDLVPQFGWRGDQRIKNEETAECETVPCWTWPEVDAHGNVLCINRRFVRPFSIQGGAPTPKARMGGGKEGLVIPTNYRTCDGPILLVEGESDVMAGALCGLCCVGRPSNVGGVEHLIELLRDVPADRHIIVQGENDQKENGLQPGKEGAEATASVEAARAAVAEYVRYYRFERKHSSIGYLTPTQFATRTMTRK
jgi:hypothetical protein